MRLLEEADLALHAGDVVSASAFEGLGSFGRIEGVRGNMDHPELQTLLPERRIVEVEGVRIGMVHDGGPRVGREQRLAAAFPGCSVIVYGHTHLPQLERHGGVWIVNPGSPTERRSAPSHSMAVLRVSDGAVKPSLVRL